MSNMNKVLYRDKEFTLSPIKPIYFNPNRQHRSHSLDVDALERSGIKKIAEKVGSIR